MLSRLLRTALVTLGPLLFAAVVSAAPKWHTLQAPHCLIVSQLSERETRLWATQFEQFTAALRAKILIEEKFLPPLTVVLFSDSGTFAPYRPLGANGKKRDVAGFFASRDTWGVIGLAESFSDEATRHIVLHEATHWMVSATRMEMPLWLNEGFAEVFSTFEAKKDHGVLGDPIPYHLTTLQRQSWVSLLELMLTSGNSPLYTNSNRNPVFYAQSWIFVHKLLFENPAAGHEILNKFFAARIRGADQISALETAFGKSLPVIAAELERYSRDGRFTRTKLAFPPEAKIQTPFLPAPPAVVEIALARVAVGSQRHDLARGHIDRAATSDPTNPVPSELRAQLEFELENETAAATSAAHAIQQGSTDAWMHIITAQSLWHHHANRGTLDTTAREIADHYARAVELQPKLRNAYTSVATLANFLPQASVADAQLLVSGYTLYPDEAYLLVGLATVQQKAGNADEAQRLLGLALAHADNLTEQQRTTAERLRSEWRIEPLRLQIAELATQRRFREALATCDALLQLPMSQQPRLFWEKRRADLAFRAAIEDADNAMRAREPTEAVRILEALLAQPNLAPLQTRTVRERLERIRTFLPKS